MAYRLLFQEEYQRQNKWPFLIAISELFETRRSMRVFYTAFHFCKI